MASRMRHRKSLLFSSPSFRAGSVLIALGILLFVNSARNQFAIDDKGIILENRFFVEGTSIGEIFTTNYRAGANTPDGLYRPVAMLTFQLNYLTTGLDPMPFHVLNIILNAVNALLLFLILKRLTGRLRLSFLAALLFACHPIHAESVASITGRPELLFTFFIFLSWLFLEYELRPWIRYPFACLALFFGLLSKETAVVFPFMVVTADLLKRQKTPLKKILTRSTVLFGVVVVYLLVRWLVLGETAAGNLPRYYDNPLYYMDLIPRILNALMILGRYVMLILLPLRMLSDYSYKTFAFISSDSLFIPVAIGLVFIGALTTALFYRDKRPEYAIGAAVFLFPYLLISNILFPIGTVMGERLMYLPSAGVMLVVSGGIDSLMRKRRMLVMIVTASYLLFFSARTVIRNSDWYDDYTITMRDFSKAPENIKLLSNMGYFAKQEGDTVGAEAYYRRALDVYPEFGEGWSGLARLAYERGDLEDAIGLYRRAAELSQNNVVAQFNYASVLINSGQLDTAEEWLAKAIEDAPKAPILHRSMGNLRMSQGDFEGAIVYFEEALRLGDSKTICYTNIAASAFYLGRYDLAWNYVQRAREDRISLNPDLVRSIRERLNAP